MLFLHFDLEVTKQALRPKNPTESTLKWSLFMKTDSMVYIKSY